MSEAIASWFYIHTAIAPLYSHGDRVLVCLSWVIAFNWYLLRAIAHRGVSRQGMRGDRSR
ncbi:hypothetical protein NDI39_06430 [Microcoleus sp. ZQ-A2]|nr:hypothetical protein [Microcoleus sp. FACHB-1]